VVPRVSTVAVIANPDSALVPKLFRYLEAAALKRGLKLRLIEVRNKETLGGAFKSARRDAQAALIVPDPLITEHEPEITALAAANKLPTIYTLLDFMDTGGLIAYGVDANQLFRRAAEYVDKVLKGANPGNLPIEQATQYRLMINLKTAKALGITIPQPLLLRADEVIR
jgi:putative ABC transport system substrate-binding protein